MPTVLILDDDEDVQLLFRRSLEGFTDLVQVSTISEAEALLPRLEEFDAICVDGCVPGNEFTTGPLVEKMAAVYRKPIVAISSSGDVRRWMRERGATHECEKKKLSALLFSLIVP